MKGTERLIRYFEDYVFVCKRLDTIRLDIQSRAMTNTRDDEYLKKLKEEANLDELRKNLSSKIRIQMDLINTEE